MELRHVKTFVMAAEHLSFSKVAEQTYLSQSSVSKHISMLESELGSSLFIRNSRGLVLSDLGAAFLPYARNLLSCEKESMAYLRHFRSGQNYSKLRIGIDTTMTTSPPDLFFLNLMSAVTHCRAEQPYLNFDIHYCSDSELYTFLTNNKVDVIICPMTGPQVQEKDESENNYFCLDMTQNYLAMSAQTEFNGDVKELAEKINLFLYTNDHIPQSVTHAFIQQYHVSAGVQLCEHWPDLFLRILLGEGASILPTNMRNIVEQCGIRIVDLPDFKVVSGLYAIWKKDNMNQNIQNFLLDLKSSFDSAAV